MVYIYAGSAASLLVPPEQVRTHTFSNAAVSVGAIQQLFRSNIMAQ